MKVLSVIGTRPQFIKLVPLSRALYSFDCKHIVVDTGQHYDYMLAGKIAIDTGLLPPDYTLAGSEDEFGKNFGSIINSIYEIVIKEKPSVAIVYGDTNSTVAGAVALARAGVPIIHIEAGLRSFNLKMPEEGNRIIVDNLSDYLFSPTSLAVNNLEKEGLGNRTYLTGDILSDSVKFFVPIAIKDSDALERYKLKEGNYNLLTIHRNYNTEDPWFLQNILLQLDKLDEPVFFPVHPGTEKVLKNIKILFKNIIFSPPLGYLDFLKLQYFCKRVITDSGGIQKEATIIGKPCITLRTETEWVETVENGGNRLIDPGSDQIVAEILSFKPHFIKKDIYGENVGIKMATIIDSVIK